MVHAMCDGQTRGSVALLAHLAEDVGAGERHRTSRSDIDRA
jgi:hypothetical protein